MSRASTTSWLQRLYAAVETSQPWGVEQPSNLFLLEYLTLASLEILSPTSSSIMEYSCTYCRSTNKISEAPWLVIH